MTHFKDRNKKPNQSKEQDYDLKKNLRQISSYQSPHKNTSHYQTGTSENQCSRQSQFMSNSFNVQDVTSNTNSEYIRLDDKLADYSTKNEDAHQSLRKAFESKFDKYEEKFDHKIDGLNISIEKCIPESLFRWILGGLLTALIAICLIWYNLSYLPTLNKVEKLEDKMNSMGNQQLNTIKLATDKVRSK